MSLGRSPKDTEWPIHEFQEVSTQEQVRRFQKKEYEERLERQERRIGNRVIPTRWNLRIFVGGSERRSGTLDDRVKGGMREEKRTEKGPHQDK